MSKKQRKALYFLLFFMLLSLVLSITQGGANVPLSEIGAIFFHKLFGDASGKNIDQLHYGLIWHIRFPRVVMAFVVGMALSLSGVVMQSVLKNPLASSYTIGVSSGAGLGAVIIIVAGASVGILGNFLLPITAIFCGLVTVALSLFITKKVDSQFANYTIILIGTVISIFMNGIIMLLASRYLMYAQRIALWQMGSFALKGWSAVAIVGIVTFVVLVMLYMYRRELDLLTFSDEQAHVVGVDVKKFKLILIFLATLLTSVTVAFVGIIGFVDLISPHIVRRFFGSRHRSVLLISALFGGSFMVLADVIARTVVTPSELPVGVVTSIIGAPFFIYVFFVSRKK